LKKLVITLLHIGYWTLYTLLLLLLLVMVNRTIALHYKPLAMFMVPFIYVPAVIGFYTFYTFLFTRFLARKKIAALAAMGLLVSLAAGLIGLAATMFTWKTRIPAGERFVAVAVFVSLMAVNALLNGVIGLVIRAFIHWYRDLRWKEELARKNVETELALVKSQINPHFLFNTLNNIDVLMEKDPARASVYFKKLSDMLRFMLYETNAEKIVLQDELAYIEKYIDLQRIRSTRPGYIQFTVTGNASQQLVAPMLFIPFIENACKHADTRKEDNTIVITFEITEAEIRFACTNRYNPANTSSEAAAGGLGNELIQKRLQLLYPGKHQLHINTHNHQYTVLLNIQL
jgi:hypothetical protein